MKKVLLSIVCLFASVGFSVEYRDLPFTNQDRDNIHKLVKTLATKEWYSLLRRKSEMENLGEKIKKTVHPLPFMACILKDSERKQYLYEIREYTFMTRPVKWTPFKEGLFDRLDHMHVRNKLVPCIPGFAQELGVHPDPLIQFAHSRNWNKFLEYIMP